MNLKLIQKSFLILIGILTLSTYIWFRFIRERLPREIPFMLFVLSFATILFSTTIYLYIIYRLIKPATQSSVTKQIQTFLLRPFEELNHFITKYYNLNKIFVLIYTKITNVYILYLCMNILPRIITVVALMIDIFLCHKFKYTYNVIYFTLIPLLIRYFIYSLTLIKDFWISELELATNIRAIMTPYVYGVHPDDWPENQDKIDREDDDEIPEYMGLPLNLFIPYQTSYIINEENPPRYRISYTEGAYDKYMKEFNITDLTSEDYRLMKKRIYDGIEKILSLSVFITTYQNAHVLHKYLRDLRIIIYALYSISWSYALYLLAPKVLWLTGLMSLLHSFIGMENPFSGDTMFYDLIEYITESDDAHRFIWDIIPLAKKDVN